MSPAAPSVLERRPTSEAELVGLLVEGLEKLQGTLTYSLEARSHGRARTDVLATIGEELLAIEVKLSDWKRAITQAALNRVFAHKSFVALWYPSVRPNVIAEARRFGIGVMGIGRDCVEVISEADVATPIASLTEAVRLRAFPSGP